MNEKRREINTRAVKKYREKLAAKKKRIEVWIDQPEALKVLREQSGLNQTEVMNYLIEIMSDGVSPEFFRNEEERQINANYMTQRILEVFQSNS